MKNLIAQRAAVNSSKIKLTITLITTITLKLATYVILVSSKVMHMMEV